MFSGQTEIVSGEVAEDITYYFAASEQLPSSVDLGVLVNPDNTILAAGGFIVILMPGCDEEMINEDGKAEAQCHFCLENHIILN